MELKFLYFIPLISVALIVFVLGLYFNIVRNLVLVFRAWSLLLYGKKLCFRSIIKVFWREVVLQRQLKSVSKVRWLRHMMIYWGFVSLGMFDLLFVLFGKRLPLDSTIRMFFKFGLELTGSVLLVGTGLALIRAVIVRNSKEKIYNYTFIAAILFVITLTGFFLEALRLVDSPDQTINHFSFLGLSIAYFLKPLALPWGTLYSLLWLFHSTLVAGFIAYTPFSPLVHSMALPIGFMMNSQDQLLETKLQGVAGGLLPK